MLFKKKKTEYAVADVIHTEIPRPVQNDELIAVLTAAIAASMNTSAYNLKIKSYKRIYDTTPAWNKAGRADIINGRF